MVRYYGLCWAKHNTVYMPMCIGGRSGKKEKILSIRLLLPKKIHLFRPEAGRSWSGKSKNHRRTAPDTAAVVFSAIFKHYNLGKIIGRETGGRESFSSDSIYLEMLNSKLGVWIPVAILSLPGNNPNRGVLQHIPVDLSIKDQIRGIDRDIEKIKELLLELEKTK